MSSRAGRAVLVGLFIAAVSAWSSLPGAGVGWIVLGSVLVSAAALAGLWWAFQRAGDATAAVRERLGGGDAGQHHAFASVRLLVEDDGRHVWIGGQGLQRVLGRREPDEVQAARHAGAWRRNERGALMLRVDAAIQHLANMPGRDEPTVQKLRRYLERDVLYPAQRRRELAQAATSGRVPPKDPA